MNADRLLDLLKPEYFETFGKYAGIGGLALACLLAFFLAILWFIPSIFGKDRADFIDVIKLLKMMVLCFFAIAMAGLLAYVASLVITKQVRGALEREETIRRTVAEQEQTKRRRSDIQGTYLSLITYISGAANVDDALTRGKLFYDVETLSIEEKGSIVQAFTFVQSLVQQGGQITGASISPPEQQIRTVAGRETVGARSLQCDGFRRYRVQDNKLLCGDGRPVTYISASKSARTIDLKFIVVHATASTQNSASTAKFLQELGTSYHLLIDRDGTIVQLVEFDKVAQHAGVSEYQNIRNLNGYSIGIGLVNAMEVKCPAGESESCRSDFSSMQIARTDVKTVKNGSIVTTWQSYSQEQLNALNGVLAALTQQYGAKEVVGHEHVSPGRKGDPGPAFPWAFFGKTSALNARSGPPQDSKSDQ